MKYSNVEILIKNFGDFEDYSKMQYLLELEHEIFRVFNLCYSILQNDRVSVGDALNPKMS